MTQRWIDREAAGKILQNINNHKQGVQIYLIKADAGTGKTYLARDIGVHLGSKSGYEPGHTDNNIYWSGILDLYDPETNNNRGLEQLLIQAFSDHPSIEFQDYQKERKNYTNMSKSGSSGGNLEEQRRNVEKAFSFEMKMIAREKHLVWAFDTVERLQSALDPTEIRLGKELETSLDDTASVVGWMLYQITRLPRATILLFGREAVRLESRLSTAFKEADALREKSDGPIHFEIIDLSLFSKNEVEQFFALRSEKHPSLKQILTGEVKSLMFEGTEGNPLLLDIALETILETGKTNEVGKALAEDKDIKEVEKMLIKTYMSRGSPEKRTLLHHLALARNGLSPQLLQCLEPLNSARYQPELEKIGDLPFVKVRQVSAKTSGSAKSSPQPTYFLHDAMYIICDEVLLKPVQAREKAERIVRWYKGAIAEKENKLKEQTRPLAESKGRRDDDIQDLLVESLFYRMRANPKEGYEWYLQQADYALNAVETGLEMRLRDSMAQFSVNAHTDGIIDSASSQIDRENIKNLFPDMLQQFTIDSAMLWVRRLSFRGLHERAIQIANSVDWVKWIYEENPKLYRLAYADFQLWTGQALMYSGNAQKATELYQDNIKVLEDYKLDDVKQNNEKLSELVLQRITHVKGRTLNNLGYTYWMYFGKYKPALTKLAQALEYFQAADLAEEEANTKDNMGRIRAQLWHEPAARLLIEDGLRIREEKQMVYRTALSRISLANMQHRFRYFPLAIESATKAMETFESLEGQRGIGLAHLTFAMIYRSMAESWQEQSINNETAIKYVQGAIDELNLAARIFKEIVQEKIRYVYALNEMGSCYRAMYMLSVHSKASDERKREIFEEGVSYYSDAIRIARENNYFVEELDSKQDLAVLYTRAKKHKEAFEQLKQIRDFIPRDYQIQSGKGLENFPEADVIDAYYKLMGQVEMLAAAIIFNKAQADDLTPSKIAVVDAMEHYVLAVAYYFRYSGISSNTYVMTTERIYKRLHDINRDIISEIKQTHLPSWIKKYNIPTEWVTPLFIDIFEMLGV
jgi:tetratricopeptide (TPR) repeat protein